MTDTELTDIELAEQARLLNPRRGMPSASSFRRFELCPGSYQLTQKARELGQAAEHRSPAAERGTRIHSWLENNHSIILAPDELEVAQDLKQKAESQIEIFFPSGQYTTLREERLWFAPKRATLQLSAQFDFVVYDDQLAVTTNFKSGHGEQDPPKINAQLKVEALLVALHLPKTIERYIAQIVTPFGVLQAEFSVADMRLLYEEITDKLVALSDEHARLNPSPDACRYCPAITICQAAKDLAAPTIEQFSQLPAGGDRAAKLLDECTVLERLIKEVRTFYHEKIETDPTCVPGYGIKPGSEVRKITDFAAAMVRLSEHVPQSAIDSIQRYPTMTALEDLLGKALKLKAAEARAEAFNRVMAGLIEVKQNKGSLKRVKGTPKLPEFAKLALAVTEQV